MTETITREKALDEQIRAQAEQMSFDLLHAREELIELREKLRKAVLAQAALAKAKEPQFLGETGGRATILKVALFGFAASIAWTALNAGLGRVLASLVCR